MKAKDQELEGLEETLGRDTDRVADGFVFQPIATDMQLHVRFSNGTAEIEVPLSATGKDVRDKAHEEALRCGWVGTETVPEAFEVHFGGEAVERNEKLSDVGVEENGTLSVHGIARYDAGIDELVSARKISTPTICLADR